MGLDFGDSPDRWSMDLRLARTVEGENVLLTYRAFEWLKQGLGVDWEGLGVAVDVPQQNIDDLKRMANDRLLASRHGTQSGKKIRIGEEDFDSWIVGVLHAIVHARGRVDQPFASQIKKDGDPWPLEEEEGEVDADD